MFVLQLAAAMLSASAPLTAASICNEPRLDLNGDRSQVAGSSLASYAGTGMP
jgi:hypothetical protein